MGDVIFEFVPEVLHEALHGPGGGIAEGTLCYTGDILDPTRTKYTLDYYLKMGRELKAAGTHILGIKDMAGLCQPNAAYTLVKANLSPDHGPREGNLQDAVLQEIDIKLANQGPYAPMFQPSALVAYRSNLTGVTDNTVWGVDFYTIKEAQ